MDIDPKDLFAISSDAMTTERERVTKLVTECKKDVLHTILDRGDREEVRLILDDLLRDIQNGNC